MTVDNFALWKFKTIEGILKNCHPADFLTTVFTKGFETYTVRYDLRTNTCVIEDPIKLDDQHTQCSFKDLPKKLAEMGLYEKKNPEECHSNALIPFVGNLEN